MDFDQAVYERLSTEFEAFARTLGFEQVRFFPISARTGDNITQPSARTPWHDGETLLGWLETLPHERRQEDAAFRFPVQYVLRPDLDYRGFAGQIVSGKVRLGDEVVVYPSKRRTHIASIDTFEGRLEEASAPASVTLRTGGRGGHQPGRSPRPRRAAPAGAPGHGGHAGLVRRGAPGHLAPLPREAHLQVRPRPHRAGALAQGAGGPVRAARPDARAQ
ncbi:hypothetical protein ACN28S_32300 [Cystobacter fuscus]